MTKTLAMLSLSLVVEDVKEVSSLDELQEQREMEVNKAKANLKYFFIVNISSNLMLKDLASFQNRKKNISKK